MSNDQVYCPSCDEDVIGDRHGQFDEPGVYGSEDGGPDYATYFLYQCPGCSGPILQVYCETAKPDTFTVFPLPPFSKLVNDANLPKSIRTDVLEADRCYHNKLYQAFGAMVRRVIHSICEDKGADKGDLYFQIEDLKNKGVFSEKVAENAHILRKLGRNGSHPEWEPVTKEMSKYGMDAMTGILSTIYELELPALPEFSALDRRRDQRK